jgi:hypothetical protein
MEVALDLRRWWSLDSLRSRLRSAAGPLGGWKDRGAVGGCTGGGITFFDRPLMEKPFAEGPVGALSGGETARFFIIAPTMSSSLSVGFFSAFSSL